MASVYVFDGIGSDYSLYSFNGKISDNISLDFDKYIILRAGERLLPESIVNESDIIYIRRIPGGVTAVVVTAVVAVAVAVGVGVYAYKKTKDMMKSLSKLQDNQKLGTKSAGNSAVQKLPWVKGASNQAATGQTFPYIIGDTLFTPYKLCPDHMKIMGTDGKDSYYYLVLEAGFAPLRIREIKIGTNVVKTFNTDYPQNGVFKFDSGNFYDDENIIEIAQNGPFTTEGFESKILMTEYMEEIPHRYESGSAAERQTITDEWQTGLVKQLPGNAMSVEVIILFDGLTWFNGNSGNWQNTSATIQVQWTNVDNPKESDWINFTGGFNQNGTYSNTFTRNSKVQMRFSAVQDFNASQAYGKNISVRVRRTTQERESNGREACYLMAVQTTCFDYAKSSKSSLVPAVPLEPDLRDKCTRIGLKVKSSAVTDGKLDKISITVTGCCRVWDKDSRSWTDERVPTRNLAAWVFEILTSPVHRPSQYDDSEIDLESFGTWYEYCEKESFYADGAISQSATKQSTIDSLVSNGNAALVINEMTGKIEVYIDNGRDYSIALLTPDNILSLTAVKQIKRLADGVRVTYVNRDAGFDTDSVTFMRNGREYKPSTDTLSPVSLSYITDFNQAYKYAWRRMAEEIARPLTATVKVGAAGVFYSLFDCVQLQHPVLCIGLGHGVIQSLSWKEGKLDSIGLFGTVDFPEAGETGIIIECSQTGGILALKVSGNGKTNMLKVLDSVNYTDKVCPSEGDTLSFGTLMEDGSFDLVSTKMLITGIEPAGEGATLTLTEYNDAVYKYGELPVYKSNITQKPESSLLTLKDVREYVDPTDITAAIGEISAGTAPLQNPDDVARLDAVAEKDGISLYWPPLGLGLKNTVQYYKVEYSTDGGNEWNEAGESKSNFMTFSFDRELFGYPEADEFATWRFRVKAVSVCDKESKEWTCSTVDASGYGTWRLQPPYIYTRVSDRTLTLMMSQPQRSDKRTVYGTVMYRVQIRRPDIDEDWFKPSVSKDPEGNEENYKDGKGFVETDGVYIQTMPLKGQEQKDLVDTAYMFKVSACNEAGESGSSEITATALCTNIKDIVRANETAKKAYISQLSALCANMGAIFQGAMGRNNNLWDLSTFIDDYGKQHYEGHFRVGGDKEFIEVIPVVNDREEVVNYHVHFVAGSFDVSAEATIINGEVIIQEKTESLLRARLSSSGLYFDSRKSLDSEWELGSKYSTDGIITESIRSSGSLVITNGNGYVEGIEGHDIGIPYISDSSRVYHFDGNLLDQKGESSIVLVGDTVKVSYKFKGADDSTNERDFSPAVRNGKSVYGAFKLSHVIEGDCWTVDFWVNFLPDHVGTYFSAVSEKDSVSLFYADDELPYSLPGYWMENDPYGIGASAGWFVRCGNSTVRISAPEGWTHIACVKDSGYIRFFIGNQEISFPRSSFGTERVKLLINEVMEMLLIDELMIDCTTAETEGTFRDVTRKRLPWGSLDYRKPWFIFDAADTSFVRSNIITKIATDISRQSAHPVGEPYIQLPGELNPAELYGFGTWEDISHLFSDNFLRVIGENSAAFGVVQEEGLPNITGSINNIQCERGHNTSASGAFAVSNYRGLSDGGSGNDMAFHFSLDASRSSSIYGKSSHVTPQNMAIRIWRRTE